MLSQLWLERGCLNSLNLKQPSPECVYRPRYSNTVTSHSDVDGDICSDSDQALVTLLVFMKTTPN